MGWSQERVIRKRIRHKAEDQGGAHLGPHVGRPTMVCESAAKIKLSEPSARRHLFYKKSFYNH
jgi:hypothetical protein